MEKRERDIDATALIVFAKTLGSPVKTRIARTEGKQVADRIYSELLHATAETIKGFPYYVAFTGGPVPGGLIAVFNRAVSFFPQTGNDLGVRMKNACLYCQDLGFARFIVIGCDCPGRTAGDIVQASQAMQQGCNVVLGPVSDGGYHLAAAWSTKELLKETLMIVEKRNLRCSLLQMRSDIDTYKDYCSWKSGVR